MADQQARTLERDTMACPVHEGKQDIMVCVSCKTVVCGLCIEDIHNGHQLHTFETAAKTVINDLMKSTESPSFNELEKNIKVVTQIREREGEHAVMTKQELLDRRDHIKHVVDQVTEMDVTKLNQHSENLFKELDEVKHNATKQYQTVRNFRNEVQMLQVSENYLEVVKQGWKLKAPEITPLEFPKIARLKFMPDMPVDTTNILFGELVQQDLHPDGTFPTPVLGHYNPNPSPDSSICTLDLFGEGPEGATSMQTHPDDVCTDHKLSQSTQSLKCDVKLTYTRSLELPSSARVMEPTIEGNCWTRDTDENRIKLVDTNGNTIKAVPCDTIVTDCLCLPVKNQVLIACPDKKCIKHIVIQEGKQPIGTSTLIHTGSLRPYFMCGISNGNMLVILTDKTSWSVEPNSTSVLVKYNSKGKELARVHKDGHGQDMFCVPFNISTSNSGTVAVVNFTSIDPPASHLMVLDNKLNLTHRYIAHGVTVPAEDLLPELSERFRVTNALFNHHNLLLVSEWYSKTVQLLDHMCNLLKVFTIEAPPYSLALHDDGDLWVGLGDGKVNVYKHTCELTVEKT